MRERFPLLRREQVVLQMLHPGPRPDVGDRVLALVFAGEVVSLLAGVFARQVDLEHADDAEGFVAVTVDGVCGLSPGGGWFD